MFNGFNSSTLSEIIFKIAANGVNNIMPEIPHNNVPIIMATKVAHVLNLHYS